MSELIQIIDQTDLVPCSKYPYAKWEYENFNPVQSRIFEVFENDANFWFPQELVPKNCYC